MLLVASFDRSARAQKNGGAYDAVIWKLTEWTILSAASRFCSGLNVNEAEYNGLLLCSEILAKQTRGRVIVCSDSNLVIRQMRGDIVCTASELHLLRHKALDQLRSWTVHEFLHIKRDWN